MNSVLKNAIKELNLSPSKTKLIIFNSEMVSLQDASQALKILKDRGQSNAAAIMVKGDVRSAVEIHELVDKKGEKTVDDGSIS